MIKLTITALLFCMAATVTAQQDLILFKKGNHTVSYFKKSSYINFQLKNRQWYTAYITKVQHDSFYVSSFIVHYGWTGPDSMHFPEFAVATSDVYAMPKKGVQFGYRNDRVGINTEAGHVHFLWIKNGWLFRIGAAGYVGLNVINGLVKHNFTLAGQHFGIAAAIFLVGEVLHHLAKPQLKLGKKYHLETVKISD